METRKVLISAVLFIFVIVVVFVAWSGARPASQTPAKAIAAVPAPPNKAHLPVIAEAPTGHILQAHAADAMAGGAAAQAPAVPTHEASTDVSESRDTDSGTGGPADRDVGHAGGPLELPEGSDPQEALHVLQAYDAIYKSLVAGDLPAVKKASARLSQHRGAVGGTLVPPARRLAAATGLKAARRAFAALSLAALSLAHVERASVPGAQAYRCTTAAGDQRWLQLSGPAANPFADGAARACGDVEAVAP